MLLLLACTADDSATKLDSADATGDSVTDSPTDSDTDETGDTSTALTDAVTITVHPVIGAMLVVRWEQLETADVWVEFGVEGEPALQSPRTTRAPGAQEQILVGVPYDSDVEVRLYADSGAGADTPETRVAHTGPLPETVPVPELQGADPSAWGEADRWLLIGLSSGGDGWEADGFWKLILDRQGRVVWAHETPNEYRTFYLQPSVDGTELVWDECTFWTDFDKGEGSLAHRMTLDGTVTETVALPGLHHAFRDLGDGGMAWGGYDGPREVLREVAADGTEREIWDCSAYWRAAGATEPCDGNALYFDADHDSFLYSSDSGNAVAEVDRATGEVFHTFGQLPGSVPFAAGTEPFWKQHGVHWTEAGTLLMSAWTSESNHQIIAREFTYDTTAGELREIWRCGEGTDTVGEYAGEAHRLSSGNTLINYGEGGELREYTPDCTEVWHLAWPYANLLGRAVFVDDLYPFLPGGGASP